MKKVNKIVIIALLGVILMSCGKSEMILISQTEDLITTEQNATDPEEEQNTETVENTVFCYVYICGQVSVPGVYAVPEGTRIYEVVELAGGFSTNADRTSINLAICVTDGQQIYIPSVEETQNKDATAGINSEGKVNINYATQDELCTIPGIGETRAGEIIAYREENGAFTDIEEIKLVSGIKDGLYQKIKNYIIV